MTTEAFVITGGTSGVGKETARILATRYPNRLILITGRSESTISAAIASFGEEITNVIGHPLELADFDSVLDFSRFLAEKIRGGDWKVVGFLHNAGLQCSKLERSKCGIEKTFHANHLGPFYLNYLILPVLKETSGANGCRIVVVSSNTHDPKQNTHVPVPGFKDPRELTLLDEADVKNYSNFVAYSSSKLCNILFVYELVKRLPADSKISVVAYDPGWIPETGLVRNYPDGILKTVVFGIFTFIAPFLRIGSTLPRSCNYLANLLDEDSEKRKTGKYYDIDKEETSSDWSYEESRQKRLWELSEQLLKDNKCVLSI